MAYACYRIAQENKQLKETNKKLELENARLKGIIEEQVRRIKSLEEKNSVYIARIATLEELNRWEKEAQILRFKRLRSFVDEYEEFRKNLKLVCCQVFQHYASRVTILISVKGWWQETGQYLACIAVTLTRTRN
jgi:septal ring factor EnvC (AmiA/AmiB activator)